MPLPRGYSIGLSRGRRFVADILHFTRPAEVFGVSRVARIPLTAAARELAEPKPGWYPILLKAFAIGARTVPELRRSLLTVPYTRLYQHACSVAAITVERELDGEPAVLTFQVRQPESTPLTVIDAKIRRVKAAPLWEVPEFRRTLRLLRYPRPVRRFVWRLGLCASGRWRQQYFGTFGSSSVVGGGVDVITARGPLTSFFTFGPVSAGGSVLLRLEFDHRVFDGMTAARGLAAVEAALHGELLAELRSLVRPHRAAG